MSVSQAFLTFYYFNATSIRGKLPDFNSHFSGKEYDLISVSESWLNDTVLKGEVLPGSNYNVFRCDRKPELTNKKDGGGTLCAVKKSLSAIRREDLEIAGRCEILWVQVVLSSKRSVFVGTIYIPTWANLSDLTQVENSVTKCMLHMRPTDSVVVLGDFNSPSINWSLLDSGVAIIENPNSITGFSDRLIEITSSNGLSQHNTLITHENNVLDLVFTNDLKTEVHYSSTACHSTHKAVEVQVEVGKFLHKRNVERKVYNFKRVDFNHVLNILSCLYWGNLSSFHTVNDAFTHFYDILFSVINDCVPVITLKPKSYPHWYSYELIKKIKHKEKLRSKYIKRGRDVSSPEYACYSAVRAEAKRMKRSDNDEYVLSIGGDMKQNPKRFWTFVASLKKSGSIPEAMTYNNDNLTSYHAIVKAFAAYFKSLFLFSDADTLPHCPYRDVPKFKMTHITPEDVIDVLSEIDDNTATGSDNLPVVFIMKCADTLGFPISYLFNVY